MNPIKYIIKEISGDGLLKSPVEYSYGRTSITYYEYDSVEEAMQAIENQDKHHGELVILATYTKESKWEKELKEREKQ